MMKYIMNILLIVMASITGCGIKNTSYVPNKLENTIQYEEITNNEETRYTYEEPTLETNEVFDETYATFEGVYDETIAYVSRFPDTELPDLSDFEKDAYGNYIITEYMFEGKSLPLNEDGVIEYISYFDENGIMVNPMPAYYNNYLSYFASYGG